MNDAKENETRFFGGEGSQGIKIDERHVILREKLADLFRRRPMVDE